MRIIYHSSFDSLHSSSVFIILPRFSHFNTESNANTKANVSLPMQTECNRLQLQSQKEKQKQNQNIKKKRLWILLFPLIINLVPTQMQEGPDLFPVLGYFNRKFSCEFSCFFEFSSNFLYFNSNYVILGC